MEHKVEPRNEPTHQGQLIFDKGGKNIQWRKESLLQVLLGKLDRLMRLVHTLTPCTEINSKWLKDLNINHNTIKFLKLYTGKTFSDENYTNVFLGHTLPRQ